MAKGDGEDQVVTIDGHRLKLTNLDKVSTRRPGTTKAEVIDYYAADRAGDAPARRRTARPPASAGRRRSARARTHPGRCSSRRTSDAGTPDWVTRRMIAHRDRTNDYPLVNDLATLTWLGADGRAGAARAAVAVRPHRAAARTRTGWCSTSTPARARAWPSAPRSRAGPRRSCRHRARPGAGDQRQQGHPPVRRAGRHSSTSDEASGVAHELARALEADHPRPRRQRHEEDAARRARCSSTGARTTAPRPRSRRTRCAAGRTRRSPRRAPGTSWTTRTCASWSSTRCSSARAERPLGDSAGHLRR